MKTRQESKFNQNNHQNSQKKEKAFRQEKQLNSIDFTSYIILFQMSSPHSYLILERHNISCQIGL